MVFLIGYPGEDGKSFMKYVVLNGRRVTETEALIPVSDRGFRFGDGVFETIPVHAGVPYLWEYHMERLAGGLEALHIRCDRSDMRPQALALLADNGVDEGLIRIQISRGTGSRGYLPSFPSPVPTVVMETMERAAPLVEAVTLWLSEREKTSPRALPTRYKLAQGLNSTLARMEAAANGHHDALQLGDGGAIAEAGSANIFWRKDGALYTPSLACGALAGVTRRRMLELSPYPIHEGAYGLSDLAAADAVVLTNATQGVAAVHRLLPAACSWASRALAHELNLLRSQDIKQYVRQARESLA
jgi:branched-chain amino acid aminotransferase